MFRRPHHELVLQVLQALNSELLVASKCYFGGGTAIVLALDEYRESVDVDFLCSDRDGWRALRSALALPTLGSLVKAPVRYARDVRTERDKISTFLEVDKKPIRVEFLLEGRIALAGALDPQLGVPVLSRTDMYAEKLLAVADRGIERAIMSRDLIDLAMMIRTWGPVPEEAWSKTTRAYGTATLTRYYEKSLALLEDRSYFTQCLRTMAMDPGLADEILQVLHEQHPGLEPAAPTLSP